jgi:hypothetical protein
MVGLGEDLFGGLGPDEGVSAVVPAVDEGADLGGEVAHGLENTSADGLAFDDAEPDLDQVHPRSVGRGEVHDGLGCCWSHSRTVLCACAVLPVGSVAEVVRVGCVAVRECLQGM